MIRRQIYSVCVRVYVKERVWVLGEMACCQSQQKPKKFIHVAHVFFSKFVFVPSVASCAVLYALNVQFKGALQLKQ